MASFDLFFLIPSLSTLEKWWRVRETCILSCDIFSPPRAECLYISDLRANYCDYYYYYSPSSLSFPSRVIIFWLGDFSSRLVPTNNSSKLGDENTNSMLFKYTYKHRDVLVHDKLYLRAWQVQYVQEYILTIAQYTVKKVSDFPDYSLPGRVWRVGKIANLFYSVYCKERT